MLIIDFSIFIKVVFSGDTSFLSQRISTTDSQDCESHFEMQVVMPCYFKIKKVQSSYCQFHSILMATCLSYMSSWMERVVRKWSLAGDTGEPVTSESIHSSHPRHMRMDMRSLMKANLDRKELASETSRFDGTNCWSKDFGSTPQPVANKGL